MVLGDMNVDHKNPNHKKAKEANELLNDFEAASMRRLPNNVPTWKSYGLHKVCPCDVHEGKIPFNCKICNAKFSLLPDLKTHMLSAHYRKKSVNDLASCGCLKGHYTSVIDNAYLNISDIAEFQVLDDAISDQCPILVNLNSNMEPREKTKIIYRRDISRIKVPNFEDALNVKDWSICFISKS